jgi:hypothetical protein
MTTDGRWCGRRSPVRRSGGGSAFLKVPLLGPNPATSAADACECPPSQGWAISSTACLGPIIIPRALLFGSLPLLAAVGGVRRAAALIVRWLAAGLGLASEPSHLPPIGPVPLKCQLAFRRPRARLPTWCRHTRVSYRAGTCAHRTSSPAKACSNAPVDLAADAQAVMM